MRKTTGLTLLELLVTLVILGIVFKLTAPSMGHLVAQYRSSLTLNQLIGGIAFARSSAITLGVATTWCPVAPGHNGSINCGARDSWDQGSIIFQDHNKNGRFDTDDTLLRRLPGWRHDGSVAWRAFRARGYLQFTRAGFTNWQNGSFIYCPGDQNLRYARRLVLNQAGRTYRAHDKNGDGVDEGSRGRQLQC